MIELEISELDSVAGGKASSHHPVFDDTMTTLAIMFMVGFTVGTDGFGPLVIGGLNVGYHLLADH
jgi:hypothetical protein